MVAYHQCSGPLGGRRTHEGFVNGCFVLICYICSFCKTFLILNASSQLVGVMQQETFLDIERSNSTTSRRSFLNQSSYFFERSHLWISRLQLVSTWVRKQFRSLLYIRRRLFPNTSFAALFVFILSHTGSCEKKRPLGPDVRHWGIRVPSICWATLGSWKPWRWTNRCWGHGISWEMNHAMNGKLW